MMFIREVKKESKLFTGFPTLHMRLPSLCMQALGLRYSTVWANRAGGQSTIRLWLKTSPQGGTAFLVKRETLLNLLYSISLNSIIQGWAGFCPRCLARVGTIKLCPPYDLFRRIAMLTSRAKLIRLV